MHLAIEDEIFSKAVVNYDKLRSYGFIKDKNIYKYSKNIMNNSFKVVIEIDQGKVKGKIFDLEFKEEYSTFRLNSSGTFSNKVKENFIDILKDIRDKCFVINYFLFDQTNRLTSLIKEKYNDDPMFIWEKFPGYAIFKKKNNKWYAVIMNIPKTKLKENSNEEVEIINLKLDPSKIESLLNKDGYYPAYHMNKKNWITIILNDTIKDKDIWNLIEESYIK